MDTDIRSRVGNRIRALRKRRGWSQEELATRASLHSTYIGGIERGERNVSLLNLVKIAQALQIEMAELLTFPSDEPAERTLRELLGGQDQLTVAFFSTFCRNCEAWKRFRELTAHRRPGTSSPPTEAPEGGSIKGYKG